MRNVVDRVLVVVAVLSLLLGSLGPVVAMPCADGRTGVAGDPPCRCCDAAMPACAVACALACQPALAAPNPLPAPALSESIAWLDARALRIDGLDAAPDDPPPR